LRRYVCGEHRFPGVNGYVGTAKARIWIPGS
jgi:hypothetical protein